ncbi:hypothetical protein B0H19DRAFT_612413 [Mycena capillaripes]|nr:hypothetical protein B0H19DRAFT_612413 [Mycena capillaripes]
MQICFLSLPRQQSPILHVNYSSHFPTSALILSCLGMRTKRPRTASEEGILTPSRKSSSYSPPQSGSQRKRRKGVDTILAGFEEDLMCPICCDIFVATHLLNPCGHSFCGDCGWQWAVKNQKTACPVCRTRLTSTPMIPNVSMDKMVDQMLLSRSYHGDTDWKIGGQKLVEFQRRQK